MGLDAIPEFVDMPSDGGGSNDDDDDDDDCGDNVAQSEERENSGVRAVDDVVLPDASEVDAAAAKRAREVIVEAPSGYVVSEEFVPPPNVRGSATIMLKLSDEDGGWTMATLYGKVKEGPAGLYNVMYGESRAYHLVSLTEATYSAAEEAEIFSWASLSKPSRRR